MHNCDATQRFCSIPPSNIAKVKQIAFGTPALSEACKIGPRGNSRHSVQGLNTKGKAGRTLTSDDVVDVSYRPRAGHSFLFVPPPSLFCGCVRGVSSDCSSVWSFYECIQGTRQQRKATAPKIALI